MRTSCLHLFMLTFSNFSPDQDDLFDQILAGEFEYLSPFWDDITQSAKVRSCGYTIYLFWDDITLSAKLRGSGYTVHLFWDDVTHFAKVRGCGYTVCLFWDAITQSKKGKVRQIFKLFVL